MSKKKTLAGFASSEWVMASLFAQFKEGASRIEMARVENILDLLRRIWEASQVRDPKALMLLGELREALRRYTWTRQLTLSSSGMRSVLVPAKTLSESANRECLLVGALMDAAGDPAWHSRLGRCPECQSWIFESKRTYCDNLCKQRSYDKDPARREQHRANMRRLYRDQKERSERAKKAIGFKGAVRLKGTNKRDV